MSDYPYDDVKDFHLKFGVPTDEDCKGPHLLDPETQEYRDGFLQEELNEFRTSYEENDLATALDSLIDLVYVAYGTALLMGVSPSCWEELWNEVQRANMSKERATSAADSRSKRKNALDVVKPAGWRGPEHEPIIARHTDQDA